MLFNAKNSPPLLYFLRKIYACENILGAPIPCLAPLFDVKFTLAKSHPKRRDLRTEFPAFKPVYRRETTRSSRFTEHRFDVKFAFSIFTFYAKRAYFWRLF
ncbi:hypothetical protein CAMRE0001_2613 [Campylobacter rectus RM3267]|uniref:Uncharacterized protein n=1 Tax=Campylobacter rectus RM3267 TaxID=553218 RepID=B9D441_CAMRE|nr:hypothetical protein CAMRE0001_2613 [Campylobacter rectus RM3267]